MKITFKTLTVTNFKRIKSLKFDFLTDTIIQGANETGKTSVFDAILWVLFGKNSQDEQNFSVKNTVDTEMNRQDHVVELKMLVDDTPLTIKRIYREKWTKKRGAEVLTYDSNESEYFWNNVPVTLKAYQAKMDEIVPEHIFKMLTNPAYFNNLKEDKRRSTVIDMAGDVSDEKVINGTKVYQDLFARLKGQKSLEDYRKEISYDKSHLKKALEAIPHRIDEVLLSNPEPQDWGSIEAEIQQKTKAIGLINDEILGVLDSVKAENDSVQSFYDDNLKAKRRMAEIENDMITADMNRVSKANMEINSAKNEISSLKAAITRTDLSIKSDENMISDIEGKLIILRSDWQTENAKEFTFDRESCKCDKCGTPFKEEDIEKTEATHFTTFNKIKSDELARIGAKGAGLQITKGEYSDNVKDLQGSIKAINDKLTLLEPVASKIVAVPEDICELLESNTEYVALREITQKTLPELKVADIADQKEMKQALQEGIDQLRRTLTGKDTLLRNNVRVEELKAEEKQKAKDLADLEKIEFTIEGFQKRRMEMIEQAVNGRFSFVKFKLFENLVTGGEVPCFKTMVHGVPYSDANRAGQIHAGIDIIGALSKTYGISAPILIDNAEAVCEFPSTDSQMIRFYVTNDPVLTIN